MQAKDISYQADGLMMVGTLYTDGDQAALADGKAGVLLFSDAFGPGTSVHERAQRLAALGYAAFVADLHGGARLYDDVDAVMKVVEPLRHSPAAMRTRATAALAALCGAEGVDGDRIAALGHCIGGTLALELGRSGAPVAAIVGFHAGLSTQDPADARNIAGEVLVCIGADDPSIPAQQRSDFEREMTEARVDWSMHLYGGVVHAFTNPEADRLNRPAFARYDADADAISWAAMVALLQKTLAVTA